MLFKSRSLYLCKKGSCFFILYHHCTPLYCLLLLWINGEDTKKEKSDTYNTFSSNLPLLFLHAPSKIGSKWKCTQVWYVSCFLFFAPFHTCMITQFVIFYNQDKNQFLQQTNIVIFQVWIFVSTLQSPLWHCQVIKRNLWDGRAAQKRGIFNQIETWFIYFVHFIQRCRTSR